MGWLPGSGCVLWIQMDERKGNIVYDLSDYGNHGTRYGASWYRGKIGYCLSFDGVDDYVEVPRLNFVSFSIEAWLKIGSVAPGKYPGIGSKIWDIGGYGLVAHPDQVFEFALKDSNGVDHSARSLMFELDKWHHVVGTYEEGVGLRIFVNRVEEHFTEWTATGLFTPIDSPVTIGGRDWVWGPFYLDGLIDAVRIYNRALSDEEIKAHYWYGIIPSLRVPPMAVR